MEFVSRGEALALHIESMILDDDLPAGERLGTKEELRQRFRVAPATFSEAIRLLQNRGLVEVRFGPGGGVFVASPSPLVRLGHKLLALKRETVSARECLAIRNALEPLVVEAAARTGTPADFEELDRILDRMSESVDDPREYLRCNWLFHRRIAEVPGSTILSTLYCNLLDFVENEVLEVHPDANFAERADEGLAVHRQLVDALRTHDTHAAGEAVARHRRRLLPSPDAAAAPAFP